MTRWRALSRTQNLRLQAVSPPAIAKRPSVVEWIGRDLAGIACGVLAEMLRVVRSGGVIFVRDLGGGAGAVASRILEALE